MKPGRITLIAATIAGGAVLVVVFRAYLDPHLIVDLANRLWACF